MKLINILLLKANSKKKSIGDKIFSLHLRSTGVILILAIFIIVITNQYHIPFKDTLIITIMLFILVFVTISIIDSYIIKKYFEPLQTLINTANRITDGVHLSERINVENNTNQDVEVEIQMICKTFNRMFDRLEHSFQHEKQFSRNISHEIKTPLAVIISSCEYAQDFTDDPEEMKDTLNTIFEQANRISDITSKLSALAKMDSSNQKLDYEVFCIDELVKITADEVLIEYESLNKNININVHGDSNIIVHADRIMMVRLFINLISNSVKYGVQNGTTDIYLYQKGNNLEVSISDNGIGIPKDNLNDIWQPFFRIDHSNPNSTGLGLPMVKKIINIHGGNIYVDSVFGKGTTFNFKIPIIAD